jgi:hypothetical protein
MEIEINSQNPFLPKRYFLNAILTEVFDKQLKDHPGFIDLSAFHRNEGKQHVFFINCVLIQFC